MKKNLTKLLTLLGVFLLLGAGNAFADDWYISGNFNDYSEDFQMQQFSDSYGAFLQKLNKGDKFRLIKKSGNTTTYYGPNGEYNLNNNFSNIDQVKGSSAPGNVYTVAEDIYNVAFYLKFSGNNINNTPTNLEFIKSSNPPTGVPKSLYVQGNVNKTDWTTNYGPEMKVVEDGKFELDVIYIDDKDNGYGYFSFTEYRPRTNTYDYVGARYAPSSSSTITNTGNFNDNPYNATTNSFKAKAGRYKMEVDLKSASKTVKLTSLDYPKEMYLFGHINNNYWRKQNYEVLSPVEGQPGKYINDYIEISGYWSKRDCDIKNNPVGGTPLKPGDEGYRVLYQSTEDCNYVALYEHLPSSDEFQKAGSKEWKYGSWITDNNFDNYNGFQNCWVNGDEKNKDITKNYALSYQQEKENNNFVVSQGFYQVEADLQNGTVKFTPVPEQKSRIYTWFYGDDANPDNEDATYIERVQNGYPYHEFDYGDDQVDVIQVGMYEDNPTHKAARQAEYLVWYKAPEAKTSSDPAQVKRQAPVINKDEAIQNAPEGYDRAVALNEAESNADDAHYKVIGTSDYYDNTLIQLLKAGDYVITANLKEDAQDLEGYTITSSTLQAHVAQAKGNYSMGTANDKTDSPSENNTYNLRQAFSTSGTNTFTDILQVNPALTYGTDFELSIAPAQTATAWTSSNASDAASLKSDYETAFAQYSKFTFYDQYECLTETETDTDTDTTIAIDGFYRSDLLSVSAKEDDDEEGVYDILIKVPCSGLYTLTFTSNNNNYDVPAKEVYSVEIYPNLYGVFGQKNKENGFNINGFSFDPTDTEVNAYNRQINLPDDFTTDKNGNVMTNFMTYIPGTYFADTYDVTVAEKSATRVKRPAASDYSGKVASACEIVMSDILTTSYDLTATIVKNGATGSYSFVASTGSPLNQSTEVDSIEAVEEGEAVYFNLQGVKVQNPEHGIYVKVQNGKASKVVL